jgi:hypothetical protein
MTKVQVGADRLAPAALFLVPPDPRGGGVRGGAVG